eukprot:CAMPEP_0115107070 /NCGR_PEP_ID=MMETSP0227-20121206/37081_1 /TAXON_ID=89957 /ORGANISM="Polarella glacialis, Strain CCMP 1383" /LENGTH=289 /DNA_ID=CAMNT_0002504887 /DNA_START=36 /DNA_END=905 /DNA_ORIENTATION=-
MASSRARPLRLRSGLQAGLLLLAAQRASLRMHFGRSCASGPATVLIDGAALAAAAVSRLRSSLGVQADMDSGGLRKWACKPGLVVVGMDCEWGRVRAGQKVKGVDVIQVAPTAELSDSVIFRCGSKHGGVPEPLKEFLEDPSILKVVVGVMDAKMLWRSGVSLKGAVDLQRVIQLLGVTEHGNGLAGLYQGLCGKALDKQHQCSNWQAAELSEAQVAYAAQDAIATLEVLHALAATHNMPTVSGSAEFARFFVDSFSVDKQGDLQRGKIQTAALQLKSSDLPQRQTQSC